MNFDKYKPKVHHSRHRVMRIAWLIAHEDLWRGRTLSREDHRDIIERMKRERLFQPSTGWIDVRLESMLREAEQFLTNAVGGTYEI